MKARKRFSQNFLKDSDILEKMRNAVAATAASHILEIGPGRGALTEQLIALKPAYLRAIEIDRDLIALLKQRWCRSLQIIEGDVLKQDLHSLHQELAIHLTVGNLPYNISTPFLLKFQEELPFCPGLFLLQKEVALRLAAQPGCKDYGRLTLMLQRSFETTILFDVPPESFIPIPAVQSSFVRLQPLEQQRHTPPLFEQLVRDAFGMRRKTLRNALAHWIVDYSRADINPQSRAEELSFDDYMRLVVHSTPPQAG
jgi:16S rRNA (adenine1518-N6/adenine1519-N6)-dimethyltransferase